MEKVISKLSNEELDLVVGGETPATFKGGYLGTLTAFGDGEDIVTFTGVLGKIVAFATVAVPVGALMSLATGVIEYFAISKKSKKEAAK